MDAAITLRDVHEIFAGCDSTRRQAGKACSDNTWPPGHHAQLKPSTYDQIAQRMKPAQGPAIEPNPCSCPSSGRQSGFGVQAEYQIAWPLSNRLLLGGRLNRAEMFGAAADYIDTQTGHRSPSHCPSY